jgi:hypothetical protein
MFYDDRVVDVVSIPDLIVWELISDDVSIPKASFGCEVLSISLFP